jgi:hypothetical protein
MAGWAMMLSTIHPGALIVQSAYPDPLLELMRAVCKRLGLAFKLFTGPGNPSHVAWRILSA